MDRSGILKRLEFLKKLKWNPASFKNFKIRKVSQKKVLWVVAGIAICVLIYAFAVVPLLEAAKKAEEEIALKKKTVLKYREYLQNRKAVEEELDRTLKQYEEVRERLLPGETPQIGAATLQEIVKGLSEKNSIAIRSFRMLEPKEADSYRKISIQVDFNPISSMLNLGRFIYDIEHHQKELMISEMDLLVFNIRMPNNIQGSMVISGLMMKGIKPKEKGRQG
ncbi:MAG: type II secretion system protein GspM [Thermodesulfobacteriota bacterium]